MASKTGRKKRPPRSGTRFAAAVGQDSHRFETGRSKKPLMLAGITIPDCAGLLGNSDADVVLHAVTNAISGITCVNVIGPVADRLCLEQGVKDSAVYLARALAALRTLRISHVSIAIEAKRPRLASHIPAMRASIARLCSLPVDSVGITVTSGEGLTEFGKGKGIQAFAVVTVCW